IAERARWLVAKGLSSEALTRIETYRKNPAKDTGELAFLNVQILFSQWEAADKSGNERQANQLAQRIETLAQPLESRLGGYWGFRISLLAEQLKRAQKYGREVADVVRRADARYAAGDVQSAAAEYGRASEMASRIRKPDVAFDLGYTQ